MAYIYIWPDCLYLLEPRQKYSHELIKFIHNLQIIHRFHPMDSFKEDFKSTMRPLLNLKFENWSPTDTIKSGQSVDSDQQPLLKGKIDLRCNIILS
jgi:hypothetical protein